MENDYYKIFLDNLPSVLQELIEFRSSFNVWSVFVQSVFLVISLLTFFVMVYIFLTVLGIVFHHTFFDRTPTKVPKFVIKTMEIDTSSSEDNYDYEEMQAIRAMEKKKELKGGLTVHERDGGTVGPTYSKKTLLLSEFLTDRDRKTN